MIPAEFFKIDIWFIVNKLTLKTTNMEKWQALKPGHNVPEGSWGFKPVPPDERYDQRVVILMTGPQLNIVLDYCHKNNLTKGEIFRAAIVEYLERRNVDLTIGPQPDDPRQTKMF